MRTVALRVAGFVLMAVGCGEGAPTRPPLTGAVAVSISKDHACAVMSSGAVECWGGDSFGQLGDGQTTFAVPTPKAVAGLVPVKALAAGASYTCALQADGGVACWGGNIEGELGNGSVFGGLTGSQAGMPQVPTPVAVTGLSGAAAALATGGLYDDWSGCTCAVLVSGAVECWGKNTLGLGPDPAATVIAPTAVPTLTDATALTVGQAACALRGDGTVACWGLGALGQPGPSASSYSATPVPVPGIVGAVAVAAGSFHACALLGSGEVWCWGRNDEGVLGDGTSADSPTPVMVTGVSGAVALSAAGFRTCALLVDGTVRCWGEGSSALAPAAVPGLTGVSSISVSVNAACAVASGGRIKCWGQNDSGQLGTGSLPELGSPTSRVTTPVDVVAGP